MILQLTANLRLQTAPLNWIIQYKTKNGEWKDKGYYNQFNWLVAEYPDMKTKFQNFIKELNLENEADLSAYHLTKEIKHPAFTPERTPAQLKATRKLIDSLGKTPTKI